MYCYAQLGTIFFIAFFLLPSCSSVPAHKEWIDQMAIPERTPQIIPDSQGSIYGRGYSISLFDDQRAKRVGDIIIVMLEERTNASKQSSTSTGKEHAMAIPGATLLGKNVTIAGRQLFENNINSSNEFSGEGSSSQSNSLTGSITVMVSDVLNNGNLVIEGEKWLTINQGEEFVKLRGIVRPHDINPDNSIPSWRVAAANITYSGKGALADANKMGWLSRFFQSIFSPF